MRRSRVAVALSVVAVGASALAVAGCGGDDLPDGTVARVGDAPITEAQLEKAVDQTLAAFEAQGSPAPDEDSDEHTQLRQQSLQGLIQQRIIVAEARECGAPCKVTAEDVTKEMQEIIKNEFNGSGKEFNTFLQGRKMTRADARQIVENSALQQKLYDNVTRGVRFTAEDAQEYYKENRAQFRTPAGRTAKHILVDTKAKADRILATLTVANFSSVAEKESEDTGSAAQGGDLGQISEGQMVPEFEKAVFALKNNEISVPVKTQFGWHIILAQTFPAKTTSFEEAKANIMTQQLETARQEAYTTWAEEAIADWDERTVYASDDLKPQTATTETESDPAVSVEETPAEDVPTEDVPAEEAPEAETQE